MKLVALAGGTGSAKLLRGLAGLKADLTVVCNVGDNFWTHGLYVCPDIDIAMYALSGDLDRGRGWGVQGDSFRVLERLARLGKETWFRLGDVDMATSLARTESMRRGGSLTSATRSVCKSLGVKPALLPVTDSPLETRIVTPAGELGLQEFWVREEGRPDVLGVRYSGAKRAAVTKEVASALRRADRVVLCPANPVTSIGPTLAVPGFRRLLAESPARVTALSPMVGHRPFSGPAAKMMRAAGMESTSRGVAMAYRGFLDAILIDRSDARMKEEIEAEGIRCLPTDTRISRPGDALRLAKELVRA